MNENEVTPGKKNRPIQTSWGRISIIKGIKTQQQKKSETNIRGNPASSPHSNSPDCLALCSSPRDRSLYRQQGGISFGLIGKKNCVDTDRSRLPSVSGDIPVASVCGPPCVLSPTAIDVRFRSHLLG